KVFIGSYDNRVYALDEDTGKLIWSFKTGGHVYSSPAVANGKVFIGSYDNRVYALDEDTGKLVWSFKTGSTISSSPAVWEGKLYVGSYDGKLYCLDAENGRLLWSYQTGSAIHSSPAVADGKVIFGSFDRNVYCLDAEKGILLWRYSTGHAVYSSPAVADGRVYIASYDGKLYAFGKPDFEIRVVPESGRVPQGGSIAATVVVSIVGFEKVTLSVEGIPPGAIAEFDERSGFKTFSATLNISTSQDTPRGDYLLTVIGTDERGEVRAATYRLQVGPYEPTAVVGLSLLILALIIALIIIILRRLKRRERKEGKRRYVLSAMEGRRSFRASWATASPAS
ncbi:MAG: PQQ-binding-like beta-propeller repeat protein, partial [Hadesarchaea archaeon]|nr:PQQ-binding-like beta-propeller repeat protein [Hadesarchaea archaeon]